MSNIGIFHHQYSYGGVDTHLIHLLNSWPNKNDNFIIISNHDNEGLIALKKNIQFKNVKYLFIHELKASQKNFLFNFYSVFRSFCKIIKCEKITNILIDNGGYPGSLYAMFLSIFNYNIEKKKIKLSLLIHHAPLKLNNIYIKIISNLLSHLINVRKINLITVSNSSKFEIIKNTPLKKLKVINNGLKINPLFKKFNMMDLPILKKINSLDKIIIGMIGPLDSHKGHKFLIDVLSKIDSKKYICLIVGRGFEFENIKKYIIDKNLSNNFFMTDFLEINQYSIIDNFDILALPTRDFEGFGYSLAEAMLLKKCVIASSVGAIKEYLTNNKNGFVIDPEDIISWVNTFNLCINNLDLRKRIGISANKTIIQKFNSVDMSNEYYKEII